MRNPVLSLAIAATLATAAAVGAETFTWKNVKIGGGGGFVPSIIYSRKQPGLVYARTDMGGLYRLDSVSKTWIPLTDFVSPTNWNLLGGESFATDPVHPNICYFAAGTYTNDWAPGNGYFMRSTDYGDNWTLYEAPFKFGGNMPGRGMGERLAIDPHSTNVLYFGGRSGNGLYKSVDSGKAWSKVSSFPVTGNYVQDASLAYTSDPIGIVWESFDTASSAVGTPCSRIFVGVAQKSGPTVYLSEDAGATWAAVADQPQYRSGCTADSCHIMPHHGVISNGNLYIPFNNKGGPYDGDYGEVWKYKISAKTWTDITPHSHEVDEAGGGTALTSENPYYGYGGLDVDALNPGVIMTTTLNSWWPDAALFRSTDDGASWTKSWYGYNSAVKFKYTIEATYPWLNWGRTTSSWPDAVYPKLGWMIDGISINPFDSDEMMYGTGATIYGTKNLANWGDTTKAKVAIKSVADGIEETAVLALAVPPITSGTGSDIKLISGVGDIGGFTHTKLDSSVQMFLNPIAGNTNTIDYAELAPSKVVRAGTIPSNYDFAFTFSTSGDGGKTWGYMYVLDTTYKNGTVAMAANGSNFLWAAADKPVKLVNPNAYTATTVSAIPSNAYVASDRASDSIYYASFDSAFYYGSGTSYTANTATGYPNGTYKIKAVPGRQGHVWVPAGTHGLWVTKDGGKSFSKLDTSVVQKADIIGYGKAATGQTYPALYITGKVSGVEGVFLSKDSGSTWTRINDDAHQYGAISYAITGDMRTYGVVYVGTNGRGVVYGDISASSTSISSKTAATATAKLRRSGKVLSVEGTAEELKVFDLRGTLLRKGLSNGNRANVDLSGLGNGLYIARWGRATQAVPVQ